MKHHEMGYDFETYSETDIQKCGSYKYMEDPNFEILLLSYAFDDEPVKTVDFTARGTWPQEFLEALDDPDVIKCAYNCAFEREAVRQALGKYQDPEQYEDTMILVAQCGLPMSLGGASEALGLGEDKAKMKEGKALIRYFCQPCKPTKANGMRTRNLPKHAPDKWEVFKKYNAQDVEAERAIRRLLEKWKPLPEEHRFWCLDAKINDKGVRIDKQLAANAVAMDRRYKEELTAQAIAISGLDNPKSVSQIKTWLADQEGQEFPSLNKKVITDVVGALKTDDAKKFMAIRNELSKSSTAKYEAMLRAMCQDDHAKGCFQFYGANRTGRFSGKLVQFQNMSKNEMPDLDDARSLVRNGHYSTITCLYDGVSNVLSELVRTAIIPEDGCKILVADFSAIEARVIAWIAGEQWRLDLFERGGDIYCQSASQMFKVPVEKHGVNGHLRQKGKVAELACIAEGQLVLTDSGLVPIENVTPDMKLWDGIEWVPHNGVVKKGVKRVITYGGLTATEDHRVWVEGKPKPILFGDAARSGSRLLRTGAGRATLRVGDDHLSGEEKELEGNTRMVPVYDILDAGPRHRFTVSNALVHNCGYGGGVSALKAFGADKMGMSEEEMQETVDLWRESSPKIVALWKSLEKAAIKCVARKTTTTSDLGNIRFDYEQGILWMTLPSGRRIAYYGAKYEVSQWNKERKVLSYMGVDQKTKKWSRLETWGGKLAENLVQATARDCLREAMFALEDAGYDIRAHVHDECIVSEPIGGRSVEEMSALMGQPIDWAPGLPLRADGYETPFYKKD